MPKRFSRWDKSWLAGAARLAIFLLVLSLLPLSAAWAKPTTAKQAQTVVKNWLTLDRQPLGALLGEQVMEVQTFRDDQGVTLYFIVYLNSAGFVIVPGDDLVEPIIGWLSEGKYDPSPDNPLGALVSRDVPGRVYNVRELEAQTLAPGGAPIPLLKIQQAQRKWDLLQNAAPLQAQDLASLPSVSDPRVDPLVMSRWGQSTEGSNLCYNIFTPSNMVCGCVATAMSQLMRFHQQPTIGVGTASYSIKVNDVERMEALMGGNGSGGVYSWADMTLDPDASTGLTQRQAIGRLTHDAGVSVHMGYTNTSSGSGASPSYIQPALKNIFKYSNAILGYNGENNLPASNRDHMVNPNLDSGYPVLLGITGTPGGHSIVCDGYGYNFSTEYHHLNMGWRYVSDAWYNLPDISPTAAGNFNSVTSCSYNIFVTGTGEIISGRVVDNGGNPISGVRVTVVRSGGGTYTADTNARGIYALPKLLSNTSFTVTPTKSGVSFSPGGYNVTTGGSGDYTTTTGNYWGVNFTGSAPPAVTLNQALDNNTLSFTTSGNANWFPETTTSYYGGSAAQSGAITDNQVSNLQTTVVGPGILRFYFKVSSEPPIDGLRWYMDGTFLTGWSGDKDWSQAIIAVPKGTHIIKWEYGKNASVSALLDCAWVDKVVYTRGSIVPILQQLLD